MAKSDKTDAANGSTSGIIVESVHLSYRRLFGASLRNVLFGLIAILLLAGAIYSLTNHTSPAGTNQKFTNQIVCSSQIISGASKAIDNDNKLKLSQYRSDIAKLSNYDHDQNCLFILVRASIALDDTQSARKYLAPLKVAYAHDPNYSVAFTTRSLMTPTALGGLIKGIEDIDKQQQNQAVQNQEQMAQQDQLADKLAQEKQ